MGLRVRSEPESPKLLAALLLAYIVLLGVLIAAPRGYQPPDVEQVVLEASPGERIAVLFWSPGCKLCDEIKPYWVNLSASGGIPGVRMASFSLGDPEGLRLASAYSITRTPTILILDHELREVSRVGPETLAGVASVSNLRSTIERFAQKTEPREIPRASLLLYPALGAAIALSPCSMPLLLLYSASLAPAASKSSLAIRCGLLAMLGLGVLGLLIVIASSMVVSLAPIALRVLGFLLLSVGVIALTGEAGVASQIQARSVNVACLSFGVVASQCSLPLIAGALLAPALSGSVALGLASLALLALGLGATLGVVLYTSGRIAEALYNTVGAGNMTRIGGLLIAILGLYVSLQW